MSILTEQRERALGAAIKDMECECAEEHMQAFDALLARLEAAEGEGARLRRALEPFAQHALASTPGSGLDVIALYVRRGAVRDACDVLAPLAQSEGLPS